MAGGQSARVSPGPLRRKSIHPLSVAAKNKAIANHRGGFFVAATHLGAAPQIIYFDEIDGGASPLDFDGDCASNGRIANPPMTNP